MAFDSLEDLAKIMAAGKGVTSWSDFFPKDLTEEERLNQLTSQNQDSYGYIDGPSDVGRGPASAPIDTTGWEDTLGTLRTTRHPYDRLDVAAKRRGAPEPQYLAEQLLGRELPPLPPQNTYPRDRDQYKQMKETFDPKLDLDTSQKLKKFTGYDAPVFGPGSTLSSWNVFPREKMGEETTPEEAIISKDKPEVKPEEKGPPPLRGWGESLGMGMAALGDAFASAGSGKGNFLQNLMDQKQFAESERRKMYDSEQRANLAEWTAKLAAKGRSETLDFNKEKLKYTKKIDRVKTLDLLMGSENPAVGLKVDGLGKDPILHSLFHRRKLNPAAFDKAHSMKDINQEIKDLRDIYKRLKSDKSTMSPNMQSTYLNSIKNSPMRSRIASAIYSKDQLNDPKVIQKIILPRIDKIISKLNTTYAKTLGGPKHEGLKRLQTSFTPLIDVIEKYNDLKKGTITPENLTLGMEVDESTGKIYWIGEDTRKELKFPSVFWGMAIDTKGLADFARKRLGMSTSVSDKAFWSAVEGISAAKRVEDAGKSLTKNEKQNFDKYMQMSGIKTMGGILQSILRLKALYNGAEQRAIQNFIGSSEAGAIYLEVRNDRIQKNDPTRLLIKDKSGKDPKEMSIYNRFKGYGNDEQAMKKDEKIGAYMKKLWAFLKSKEVQEDPFYYHKGKNFFIRESRILNPEKYKRKPIHPELKKELIPQKKWFSWQTASEFSKEGHIR